MVQLWVRAQLGVSGVGVTVVVHHWFSCGSACYGLMVYDSVVGHLCVDWVYLVQVWFSLLCVYCRGCSWGSAVVQFCVWSACRWFTLVQL